MVFPTSDSNLASCQERIYTLKQRRFAIAMFSWGFPDVDPALRVRDRNVYSRTRLDLVLARGKGAGKSDHGRSVSTIRYRICRSSYRSHGGSSQVCPGQNQIQPGPRNKRFRSRVKADPHQDRSQLKHGNGKAPLFQRVVSVAERVLEST